MNAVHQLLTDQLDIWTAAETAKKSGRGRSVGNGVSVYGVKKLRELILGLAVRGKLVSQASNDEPASELLMRIQVEKDKLIAEDKIKKDKPLLPIIDEEKPYELPYGWTWTNLVSISLINPRNNAEDNSPVSFVPMTMIGAKFNSLHDKEVRLWKEIKQGFTHFAEGDIGVAKITPCFENSKACVFSGLLNGIGAGTTELHIVRTIHETLAPRYVLAYLKSPQFLLVGETKMTGTAGQKRLPKEFVESNPFPLPPLAEQHRIVAKVDELMALCDQLEAQHNNASEAHEKLVSHLLGTLTQSQSADDFIDNWQRIAEHFDTLFTTESSIDALKQTLLQLAVMGKLVPQDPGDEPAGELMHRLRVERDRWLTKNEINDSECKTMKKKLAALSEANAPFMLPNSWSAVHLIDCSRLLVDCHNKTAPYSVSGIPIIRTSNIRGRKFRMEDLKYVSEDTYQFWSRRCSPIPGDIMFTREAPMGEAAIIPAGAKYCLGQRTMLIRPMHDFIFNEYLLIALTEPHLLERSSDSAIGATVKNLRVGDVEELNIPFPPLAEQHRIVAKVDELMALCDQLKTRITAVNQLQQKLADVLIEKAIA
jgi:type I restriction enzyme, S subunit